MIMLIKKQIMKKNQRSVTFSDEVTYFIVPARDEVRMGTWKLDALRFKLRILEFEKIFVREVTQRKKHA